MAALEDYIDVPARIKAFRERYPDGSLQSIGEPRLVLTDQQNYIWYGAKAYRGPDDEKPGIGWAQEPIPGKTNFTRNSELQNAETSAWGRAITAAMLEPWDGKIASREEVRNRQAEGDEKVEPVGLSPDEVKSLVAELDKIGIERQALKLKIVEMGVKPGASFEKTLGKLSPAQALELGAWANGEMEQ